MTNRVHDTVLGATLLLVAGSWTWLVIDTIPPGFGDGEIGARAFPLAFGVILLVLTGLLLLRLIASEFKGRIGDARSPAERSDASRLQWLSALMVLLEITLYGYLLEKIGFLLATPVLVLLVMLVSLRVRSLPKLVCMSLGLTVGCWLIFEKLLGIYLANGTWLNVG